MTNESNLERIPIDQIPKELREDLSPSLQHFSVTLIGVRGKHEAAHCGSGTLVRVGGQPFILTAAHCQHELSKWDEIGIAFVSMEHRFTISKEPAIVIRKKEFDEWGPDLAFLPIPAEKVGTLAAYKSFRTLERHKEEMLREDPKIEHGLWAVVGTPASTSILDRPPRLELRLTAHWVSVHQILIRDGFDYLDIGVSKEIEDQPPSFKGVSGGGLWQIDIGKRDDGSWTEVGFPKLVGIAYWGDPADDNYTYIRCHGPRSIYEHGLARFPSVPE